MTDEELADHWPDADITGYLYGPISGRENDIVVLNMSWLNSQLMLIQEHVTQARARGEEVLYFSHFSDSIFPYHQCITHRHEPPLHGELPARLEEENKATNSIRTSIHTGV